LSGSATTGVTTPRFGQHVAARVRQHDRGAVLLCLVLIAILAVIILVPLGFLFYGAVRSGPPRAPGAVFTLANLAQIYASADFIAPLLGTLSIGIAVALTSVAVGFLLAWAVVRTDIPRPELWEKLFLLPMYFSPLMLALAFMALAAPRVGFVNLSWQGAGGSGSVVNVYSFAGIVFVLTVHYAPYAMLVLSTPIRAISAELEEAAQVLGSPRWEITRRVVLPMLWPALFSAMLIVCTMAAENFAVPTLLGRDSKIRTIPSEIYYWLSYEPSSPNLAAAAGTMLLLLTVAGIFVYRRMTRTAGRFVTVSGKPKPMPRQRLGRWRGLITMLLLAYLVVTTMLPIAALVFGSFMKFIGRRIDLKMLTLQNYENALSPANLGAVGNSLLLAVMTATIAAALGFLISYSIRRTTAPGRGLLDYLSALPIAIPGMVLGVGMLWTYVGMPFGIWGSIWVLLLAYLARFIVHAVRATGASLLQVSGEMDEAARVLGAGLFRRLMQINLPISKRAILSSWVLVAIFVLNEITSTVLLYSSRSITLSVLTWNALDMSGAMQAFAFSVLQGALTAVLVWASFRIAGKTTW
jgi:iron(III) transport system permease protein